MCRVKNMLKNKTVFILIKIVTVILLLLYYHHKNSIKFTMCRPRLYITGACILDSLVSYLKSLYFACMYVCMYVIAVLKYVFFLEYFLPIEFILKKKFFHAYDCTLH